MDYSPLVAQAAQKYNVPFPLAMSVMHAESGGNPNAVSPTGAQGLMQLEPGTAADMGVTNPMDPAQNIDGGVGSGEGGGILSSTSAALTLDHATIAELLPAAFLLKQ